MIGFVEYWWLGLALVLPCWFLWTLLHEGAHVLAAVLLAGARVQHFRPWPHITADRRFVFGSMSWVSLYELSAPSGRSWRLALISLAPRIPNAVAALVLPFGPLFDGWTEVVWAMVWGAGLVDLGVGSLGVSPWSDLRRGARALGRPAWVFRVLGWTLLVVSLVCWAVLGLREVLA
jgi:hypothetical protein